MEYINMSNFSIRENKTARFIIQNEKMKIELESSDYNVDIGWTGDWVSISIPRDARSLFSLNSKEFFSITEITECGEYFYPNMQLMSYGYDTHREGAMNFRFASNKRVK